MFSRKSLPVGTLFMVLVIMLALLGVGYAFWGDLLTVEGEVHTGSVDMKFVSCVVDDEGNDPGYEKDAASCSCGWLEHEQDSNVDAGPDRLKITIRNGYPSYTCTATYTMRSVGTVPVHLYSINKDYDPNWLDVEETCDREEPYQLHQGDEMTCTTSLHVRQEAAEGEVTHLYKEYLWGQYNEEPPDVIRVESPTFNFSDTGWAGWSCPSDHPYVVGGGSLTCTLPFGYEGPAKPGAVTTTTPVYTYPNYPHYVYHDTWTPPEEGWVVQNGGAAQSCEIYVDCSTAP